MRVSIAGKAVLLVWLSVLMLVGCQKDPPPTPTLERTLVETDTPTETPTLLPSPVVLEPTATVTAQPTETETPIPTPSNTPTPVRETVLVRTDSGELVQAKRVGYGAFKVVLAADNNASVQAAYDYFVDHADELPKELSVWFVPNLNPEQRPDFLVGADTWFDGCEANNMRGPYFDSAESRALHNFITDSALTIFYQTGPLNQILVDSCRQHVASDHLSKNLFETTQYPVAPVLLAGHFVDYLAAQGIPTALIQTPANADPQLQITALQALFSTGTLLSILDRDSPTGAITWLDEQRLTRWEFSAESLIHPLAVTMIDNTVYLLDSGRILALDTTAPTAPTILLQGGDIISNTRVLELIDLSADGSTLLALDRAGDVYTYTDNQWMVERYDRPIRDRSAHYFLTLESAENSRYLVESSAPLLLRYNTKEQRVRLSDSHYPIDVSVVGEDVYVLIQGKDNAIGEVRHYIDGTAINTLQPNLAVTDVRQLHATEDSVFVLDRAGRRVLLLERATGTPSAIYQFTDRRHISAVWSNPDRTQIIFAGQDALYWVKGGESAEITAPALLNQPNNFNLLNQLNEFVIPIGVPSFIQRDYQMAGAPRHYRLGVHEGIDFYWQAGTEIRAAAAGTIIRADWEYVPPPADLFNYWRGQAYALGHTPEDAEDFFRGRQIWIEHENGIISRYVHLSAIQYGILEGKTVEQGDIIAYVGNSGSPGSLTSTAEDAHLHFEFRIGEGYFGQYLRPIETRYWVRKILQRFDILLE